MSDYTECRSEFSRESAREPGEKSICQPAPPVQMPQDKLLSAEHAAEYGNAGAALRLLQTINELEKTDQLKLIRPQSERGTDAELIHVARNAAGKVTEIIFSGHRATADEPKLSLLDAKKVTNGRTEKWTINGEDESQLRRRDADELKQRRELAARTEKTETAAQQRISDRMTPAERNDRFREVRGKGKFLAVEIAAHDGSPVGQYKLFKELKSMDEGSLNAALNSREAKGRIRDGLLEIRRDEHDRVNYIALKSLSGPDNVFQQRATTDGPEWLLNGKAEPVLHALAKADVLRQIDNELTRSENERKRFSPIFARDEGKELTALQYKLLHNLTDSLATNNYSRFRRTAIQLSEQPDEDRRRLVAAWNGSFFSPLGLQLGNIDKGMMFERGQNIMSATTGMGGLRGRIVSGVGAAAREPINATAFYKLADLP